MVRFLKDVVVILKMINVCLILVGGWINTTVTQATNPQSWLMVGSDSYRRYQCTTTSVGILSPIVCSHSCCTQHRCIGMFFNELSSECLLINTVEKAEPCADLDWAKWQPYRKNKESVDTCNEYLMHSGDYTYQDGPVQSVLYYTPPSNNEVGGLALPDLPMQHTVVKFDQTMNVRGVATQGRWRDETTESCCDERVTSYKIHYSADCLVSWTWTWADNDRTFEANVIPDAGNEVVVNLFNMPVAAKCFAIYPVDYHLHNVIRWDLVGCGIN